MEEFHTILLGKWLKIYTDNKKICINFNTDRLLRWRLILKEYIPEIEYVPDEKNKAADALSRFTDGRNQKYIHKSSYSMETMLELYDIR